MRIEIHIPDTGNTGWNGDLMLVNVWSLLYVDVMELPHTLAWTGKCVMRQSLEPECTARRKKTQLRRALFQNASSS